VFVAAVSTEELLGIRLPVRLTLEKFPVEHTLSNMTQERLKELWDCLQAMELGAWENNLSAINGTDIRFHEATVFWLEQPHTVPLWKSVESRTRA
jgi:DNA-binding GntR family transcriptional regulator